MFLKLELEATYYLSSLLILNARYFTPNSSDSYLMNIECFFYMIFFNRSVRYSRAGENNPTAKLYVRKMNDVENKEVIPPKKVLNWGEYIFTDIIWASDTDFR